MLERITIQWLAGFFDGEGGVSIYKSSQGWRVKVSITQNDKSLLEAIRVKFPQFHFGTVKNKRGLKLDGTQRDGHEITVDGGPSVSVFLETIKPFVVRKLMDVEIGLEFCATLRRHEKGKKRTKLTISENSSRLALVERMHASRKLDSILLN